MSIEEILNRLVDGTVLEGPFFTEPVKVLSAKGRGTRIEVRAVGLHSKQLWSKLLKADDFDGKITITPPTEMAVLNGDPTQFRLAAEAHRGLLKIRQLRARDFPPILFRLSTHWRPKPTRPQLDRRFGVWMFCLSRNGKNKALE